MCELCDLIEQTTQQIERESQRMIGQAYREIDRLARGDLEGFPTLNDGELTGKALDAVRGHMIITRASYIVAAAQGITPQQALKDNFKSQQEVRREREAEFEQAAREALAMIFGANNN